MKTTELLFGNHEGVSTTLLVRQIKDSLCEFAGVSKSTLAKYEILSNNFVWYLNKNELTSCGKREFQRFFLYLRSGHDEPGDVGATHETAAPLAPAQLPPTSPFFAPYFRYLVREGVLDVSPLEAMPRPVDRPDQVQPFTTP